MYRGFLVDRALLADDPHLSKGCTSCHRGDPAAADKTQAHAGLVKRPSDDVSVCGACHDAIARAYRTSLHYTTAGLLRGVSGRFAPETAHAFSQKVFPAACQSCHASCGDCHVKSPAIGGVSAGLIKGHRFVRRDEGRTCALCHGGRVYPEFTGEYGGTPDVHYERGMVCVDCHGQAEIHGDGSVQTSRKEVKGRATCAGCHAPGAGSDKAQAAHQQHDGRLSCAACHASGPYRNCQDCHLGQGATAKPGFLLGVSPRDGKTVTTLRLIPTVRDTFAKAGLRMDAYDKLPNYWDTAPHNLRKRTERTRSCDVCHVDKQGFLTRDGLPKDGSRANEGLVRPPRDLTTR